MIEDLRLNALLDALPESELERLSGLVELVDAPLRLQVHEPRGPIADVYFPLRSVFSMVVTAEERVVVEVGTIGYEGMVGLPLFLGVGTSPHAAFCQVAGPAARLSAADFAEYLATDGALHRLLHRYTQSMMVQMAQTVLCNSTHGAEQRLSRWLLMTSDRMRSDTFGLTQEFLAQMLGVRRATVSDYAGKLQAEDLISYTRGSIVILDHAGLRARSCECYEILRREFEHGPGDPSAPPVPEGRR
jgi:CRP-like cAMP-binding protein